MARRGAVVWARYVATDVDRMFHVVAELGASVVTACNGRWARSEPTVFDVSPPHALRCEACLDLAISVHRTEAGLRELAAVAPIADWEAAEIRAMERRDALMAAEARRRERARVQHWAFEFDVEQLAISDAYLSAFDGESG